MERKGDRNWSSRFRNRNQGLCPWPVAGNVLGYDLDRNKRRRKKTKQTKQKKPRQFMCLSILTLNIDGLNSPVKIHRLLPVWITK